MNPAKESDLLADVSENCSAAELRQLLMKARQETASIKKEIEEALPVELTRIEARAMEKLETLRDQNEQLKSATRMLHSGLSLAAEFVPPNTTQDSFVQGILANCEDLKMARVIEKRDAGDDFERESFKACIASLGMVITDETLENDEWAKGLFIVWKARAELNIHHRWSVLASMDKEGQQSLPPRRPRLN